MQSLPNGIIMGAIIKRLYKFRKQPVQDNKKNPRPMLTEEDNIAKKSLFLVPSTMLFKTLAGLNII
jgi:hypothetical protein